MNVISIRAHHALAAKVWLRRSVQEIAQNLIQNNYISYPQDPFLSTIVHYLGLWEDVSQQFRLQVGGLDYICRCCPKLERGDCNPVVQEKRIVDVASWTPEQDYRKDSELIAEHQLDIHQVYTVSELREILNF